MGGDDRGMDNDPLAAIMGQAHCVIEGGRSQDDVVADDSRGSYTQMEGRWN